MQIESLYYKDGYNGWELSETHFGALSLLVGVSGAGKTQVLHAVTRLSFIATNGTAFNGVSWRVGLKFDEATRYVWEGAFTLDPDAPPVLFLPDVLERGKEHFLYRETVTLNGKTILKRLNNETTFQNHSTPKLNPFKSALHIFSGEEILAPLSQGFERLFYQPAQTGQSGWFHPDPTQGPRLARNLERYIVLSEKDVINAELSIGKKTYILFKKDSQQWQKLKENIIEIFPQIEDVEVVRPARADGECSFFRIKIQGAERWTEQIDVASGILKTMYQLAELFLSPDGTIFLIDEFENSLGINCLGALSRAVLEESYRHQFILTSHHPYIINKIPYKYWKLVTRRGGRIRLIDAPEIINPEKSYHDAFIQLINLEEYKEGVRIETEETQSSTE